MNIRQKLSLRFVFIVAFIIIFSSAAIYYFFAKFREEEFYKRLHNKSFTTAQLFISVEELDEKMVRKIEKNNPVSLPQEKIRIYNHWNELLYSSDKENFLNIIPSLLHEIRSRHELRYKQGDHEVLAFLYNDRLGEFIVIIGAVDMYGMNKLIYLRNVLILTFIFSIVLTMLSGWIYADKALKPITRVIDQVNDISISSLNLRVDEGEGNDEISRLAATFNHMLGRLERSFKIQENFIANASHELRTPLTAITGQIEVVLMKDRNPEEYKSVLLSVFEDINNLILISNRLLVMAQTNNAHAQTDFKPVRIDEVLWQSKTELVRRFPHYDINISFSPAIDDADKLTVTGNEVLVKTAVLNLMDNACKYSPDHSVRVIIGSSESGISVEFSDNGIGIPEADMDHILEPFHRGKNVIDQKGHGIGLSLVDLIMKMHQGDLEFSSEQDQGSKFVINFRSSG